METVFRKKIYEAFAIDEERLRSIAKIMQKSSRPGESHPEALTEPCVSLSTHTALASHSPTTSR